MKKILIVCTTDSMIWNFLVPHIKELKKNGYIVDCACSHTGFFFNELNTKEKLNLYEIPFERSPYNFKNIKNLFILNNLVKNQQYDIVECHEPVGGVMGRVVGKINCCKVVYFAHGFHFYKGAPNLNNFLYKTVENLLSFFTDLLITINNEDYLYSKKMNSKKIAKINGIGVDTSVFSSTFKQNVLRTKYFIKDDDIILLSVGELIKRKNHIAIIKALSLLKNKDVHYFIVGDGMLFDDLKSKIKKLNLEKQIHLLGYRKDVNLLVNCTDVFVLPSLQEGLSVALMEAMSCGKPVIASNIRGNVDLIDHDKGGLLIEKDDIKGYAKAIEKMVENKKELSRYGEYNKEKIKNFDTKIVNKQINELYENLWR